MALTDDEFLSRFHHGQLEGYAFPHRAHLRLAWLTVRHVGIDQALRLVTSGIRSMAERRGQSNLYHDTLTRAWMYVVAALDADDPLPDFERFLHAHPELLDKEYLLRHYSPQRLASPEARARFLLPDRLPIPGVADDNAAENGGNGAIVPLPLDEFRRALEHVPLSVSVLAAHDAIRVHAVTVSSVAIVPRDPAMLVVAIGHESRILPVVRAAGGFSISYLAADQTGVADRFADRERGENTAQFHGVGHTLGPFGAPILAGAPAWFECRLSGELRLGNHRVLCGTVAAAGTADARPLQRFRGSWV